MVSTYWLACSCWKSTRTFIFYGKIFCLNRLFHHFRINKILSHHFCHSEKIIFILFFPFSSPITLNYFAHMCAKHVGFLSTEIEKMSRRINAMRISFLTFAVTLSWDDWRREREKVNKFEVVPEQRNGYSTRIFINQI